MRAIKTSPNRVLNIFLLICLLGCAIACKKDSAQGPPHGRFRFTYNETHYDLSYKDGTAEWGIENSGIFIYRPDIFNGSVHFPYDSCAFLDPGINALFVQRTAYCDLSTNSLPIDSVKVYLYQSGSVNISYKNCSFKSEYDPFTGTNYSYNVCDANGAFNLVLKNKENKTITITNGTLELHRIVQ